MQSAEFPRERRVAFRPSIDTPHSAFRIPHLGGVVKVLLAGGGTGGHLMPALALAQTLRDAGRGIEPVLVGAARGIEAQVLPRYPFRHHLLPMEPIYRRTWWNNARWLLIAGRAWRAVGRVLEAEQPAIVIGTGGYAAGPVVWRAQQRRLPTVLQEQNAFPGLATRWLARRARQVHLGFPEARERLRVGPHTAVFALGNPIRTPEPGSRDAALVDFGLAPERPTLLVFGGRLGQAQHPRPPPHRRGRSPDVQCGRARGSRRGHPALRGATHSLHTGPGGDRAGCRPLPARVPRHPGPESRAPRRRSGDRVEDLDTRRV